MIYIFKKLKGAYVRSRARWIEKGEKSNNYFCRLEKKRQENNSINSLYVNGDINRSPKIISSEIFQFYSSLYSSSFSESDCNIFFNNIHSSIPQLEQGTLSNEKAITVANFFQRIKYSIGFLFFI